MQATYDAYTIDPETGTIWQWQPDFDGTTGLFPVEYEFPRQPPYQGPLQEHWWDQ